MVKNLYLARARRYVEVDPVRGIDISGIKYSDYNVVIASNSIIANEKFLVYLRQNTRADNWEMLETRELTAGADIPLEKRIEILREVFPVVE